MMQICTTTAGPVGTVLCRIFKAASHVGFLDSSYASAKVSWLLSGWEGQCLILLHSSPKIKTDPDQNMCQSEQVSAATYSNQSIAQYKSKYNDQLNIDNDTRNIRLLRKPDLYLQEVELLNNWCPMGVRALWLVQMNPRHHNHSVIEVIKADNGRLMGSDPTWSLSSQHLDVNPEILGTLLKKWSR